MSSEKRTQIKFYQNVKVPQILISWYGAKISHKNFHFLSHLLLTIQFNEFWNSWILRNIDTFHWSQQLLQLSTFNKLVLFVNKWRNVLNFDCGRLKSKSLSNYSPLSNCRGGQLPNFRFFSTHFNLLATPNLMKF